VVTWHSRYSQCNGTGNFTHKIPIEILLKTFRLVAPPHTRKGVYDLLELTHVCRFWRAVLVNQPYMWSTIFATQQDRRGFIEMCLRRSQAVALDVTVNACKWGSAHKGCTCDEDERGRLLPNEMVPCEWHFAFESFATPEHSKRIHTLNIDFRDPHYPIHRAEGVELALGACWFFSLSFPQLISLGWNDPGMDYVDYIFSNSPFTPALRSLSFEGFWFGSFTQLNNLTSFTLVHNTERISVDAFLLFLSNNQSLESLSLDIFEFRYGDLEPPPVHLPNLKSFSIHSSPEIISGVICIPALQRLSSLRISMTPDATNVILGAVGDGITLSVEAGLGDATDVWEDITGHARPTIRHARLCDYPEDVEDAQDLRGAKKVIPLLADVHTLEVGRGYLSLFYPSFLDDLKQLGPQLKTIRFEVWEEMEPFKENSDTYEHWGGCLLDEIEDLVKHRFEEGRPFSVVERMVVSESERSNRLQDHVWRCFYGDRNLGRYLQPV
jgi:hypothetical protein